MSDISPRTTQHHGQKLGSEEFKKRFLENFRDPTFSPLQSSIDQLAEIAFTNYLEGHKAPLKEKAGPGYENPDYELSVDWIRAKKAIDDAQRRHDDPKLPTRILLINGSHRNENTCPGEISKSTRLLEQAKKTLQDEGVEVQLLDLNLTTAEYGRMIHPCKGCVSTAMPLCHWPCSCYPNHSLGQAHDWMNEIYPMWAAAHGIMIITPVYWYQAPSALKLMIDRLVCADGGNADPTSTNGKSAIKAKEIEMKGWDFPGHLEGRYFSILTHGDTNATDEVRVALRDWLEDMRLIHAGGLSRYIGYMKPYATSHHELDEDKDLFDEVEGLAKTLTKTIQLSRQGKMSNPAQDSDEVRRK